MDMPWSLAAAATGAGRGAATAAGGAAAGGAAAATGAGEPATKSCLGGLTLQNEEQKT